MVTDTSEDNACDKHIMWLQITAIPNKFLSFKIEIRIVSLNKLLQYDNLTKSKLCESERVTDCTYSIYQVSKNKIPRYWTTIAIFFKHKRFIKIKPTTFI